MTIASGTITLLATGFITVPSPSVTYRKVNGIVTLFIPTLSGTSNANTFTLTGLPPELTPSQDQGHEFLFINDNGVGAQGAISVLSTGVITLYPTPSNLGAATWTASGVKAAIRKNLIYHL